MRGAVIEELFLPQHNLVGDVRNGLLALMD
jgi:hypothetical protein